VGPYTSGNFFNVNFNKYAVFSHEMGALFRGGGWALPGPLTLSTGYLRLQLKFEEKAANEKMYGKV